MIGVFQTNSSQALIAKIEGEIIAQGVLGNNTAGSPNFSDTGLHFADPAQGAFHGVLAGDAVYLSGVSAPFVVQTVSDDHHLVFTGNIAAAHVANGIWRIKRGGIGLANVLWPPYSDGGKFLVYFQTTTFVI